MTRIEWDKEGEHFYETGVDHGVLYPFTDGEYKHGVAWNGLTNVTENRSGAEPNKIWADNINYLTLMSAEEFGITIEAYSSPEEFDECDGTSLISTDMAGVTIGQQSRKKFGFCYRTLLGNDTELNDYGYLLHLVYGLLASPSERAYETVNDSPEPATLSWECTSTPVSVTNHTPTCVVTIDSTKADKTKLASLEKVLYEGYQENEEDGPILPLPDDVINLMNGKPMKKILSDSQGDVIRDSDSDAVESSR